MPVQQLEEVYDCRQRHGLTALVPRKSIVTTAGQTSRGHLAQPEFAPDTPNFLARTLPITHHQLIPRSRVTQCAVRIELDLAAVWAAPAGQAGDLCPHAGMIDTEGLAFESQQTLLPITFETVFHHFTSKCTFPRANPTLLG